MSLPCRNPSIYEARANDWRVGHLIYQVIVDRFAPTERMAAKAEHYAPPRRLFEWNEPIPAKRTYLGEERVSGGEVIFYGGDLPSLQSRLDYLQQLGVEVLYLNPIFEAFTNHKYDASDYFRIDPQYGTEAELKALAEELHRRGMRLMLDGVLNHIGRRAPMFQRAQSATDAPERDLFLFGEDYPNGYRGWRNVANLPELNLENAAAREMLWGGRDSVVRHYIREVGIDGWRLDVAPDIGPKFLREITDAAHAERADTVVIGETWNYPAEWMECLDGIMNMHCRSLLLELAAGKLSARLMARMLERMIDDAGIEGLLRSHQVLDNHDVPRLTTTVPQPALRRLARVLQFALPGCPVIYYGSEIGMEGGADPTNRSAMRWDLVTDENPELALVRQLVGLRNGNPALRVGDCLVLESEELLSFMRRTADPRETIVVMANPGARTVHETTAMRDSFFMDSAPLECLLTGERTQAHCGMLEVTVPPGQVRMFRTVDRGDTPGYSMFKRVP